jgi:hypothetical protein
MDLSPSGRTMRTELCGTSYRFRANGPLAGSPILGTLG